MSKTKKYFPEVRERAVRLVQEARSRPEEILKPLEAGVSSAPISITAQR